METAHARGLQRPHAHEVGHGHGKPRPFARLVKLLRPERRDVFAVVLYSAAVAVLLLATPIAVESLVNTVAFGVLLWPLIVLAGVLMSCLGLAAAIRAMQTYVIECIQRRVFVRVVADYAQRLPRLKLEAFDQRYGPELGNRFFDVINVQKSLAMLLLDGVSLVVTAVVGMVVLAFYHPFLLGFDVVMVLLTLILLFGLGWGGVNTSLHESHAKYDVAGWLEELLRSHRTFKFYGGNQIALERADQLASEYVATRRDHFRIVWRQTLFALGLQVFASTTLLGLGGWLVVNRQLTLGQLVAAELIVALVVASIAKLGKYVETYYDLLAGAEKLGLLTDLPLERSGGETLPVRPVGMALRVGVFDAASTFQRGLHIDWQVAPNERVAVTGRSGVGKSLLFEMLCGLRGAGDRYIELDGVDLRELNLEELRNQIALVESPEVVVGTVAENVRLGRRDLTSAEIREALQTVGLLEDVHHLPHGMETPLVPSGRPLSLSQTRRLALARAIVGRPRLLILDGALDGLDLAESPELLDRLFDRAAPWTLLVSSHDPAVTARCERTIDLSEHDDPPGAEVKRSRDLASSATGESHS